MQNKTKMTLRTLVYAAMCLALCLILPFLTGNNRALGTALCLMHIPVFLAGFLCGPWWAMAVGAAAPVLRHAIFQAPPSPTFAAMAVELAVYGLVAGLLYRVFPKKVAYVYVALVVSMAVGRIASGLANLAIYGLGWKEGAYTMNAFLTAHFAVAWPGIILHIVLVPALVFALRRAKLLCD